VNCQETGQIKIVSASAQIVSANILLLLILGTIVLQVKHDEEQYDTNLRAIHSLCYRKYVNLKSLLMQLMLLIV
jgi:hypothetical protein